MEEVAKGNKKSPPRVKLPIVLIIFSMSFLLSYIIIIPILQLLTAGQK
ncbi:protein of unknown function [Candidatus Nitrosacidococcus tergens]|uniref:Uncharacterized protein n=1 Tax=Candidatus Nitrosacidococcus tergens TaxID=553981 RepID=A0A7G1Q713_9GAMM|nr:protein of unknown function [Candidatus Nitrosacidococcus tergens]